MTPQLLRGPLALLALLVLALPASAGVSDDVPAPATFTGDAVTWRPTGPHHGVLVVLQPADGPRVQRAFGPGEPATLTAADLAALGLADGEYQVDVVVMTGEADPGDPESTVGRGQTARIAVEAGTIREVAGPVITGNQTIRQSLCVGVSCADSESYGAINLLLKADNLSIRFDDTSTLGGFPANDWELVANDSPSGGQDYFGIRDVTGSTTPFRVDAGVATDGLRVSPGSSGTFVGVGTAPAQAVHARTSNVPTLRLEQQSASFGDYTWDLGAYESYFYVEDRIAGTFPFYVGAGATDGALVVEGDDVVLGFSGTPVNLVTTGASTTAGNAAFGAEVEVDGAARFHGEARFDGDLNVGGKFVTSGDFVGQGRLKYLGDYSSQGGNVFRIRDKPTRTDLMVLDASGNLSILGTLSQGSDATTKEDLVPVDPEAVLQGVVGLPISTWSYIADDDGTVHLGPMAQDFYRTFGLGPGETTISMVDTDGVALASVQALHARAQAAQARIAALEATVDAQAARLAHLEAAVERIASQN